MATVLFFTIFFLLVALLGPLFGVDSRDGRDWWTLERRLHHS